MATSKSALWSSEAELERLQQKKRKAEDEMPYNTSEARKRSRSIGMHEATRSTKKTNRKMPFGLSPSDASSSEFASEVEDVREGAAPLPGRGKDYSVQRSDREVRKTKVGAGMIEERKGRRGHASSKEAVPVPEEKENVPLRNTEREARRKGGRAEVDGQTDIAMAEEVISVAEEEGDVVLKHGDEAAVGAGDTAGLDENGTDAAWKRRTNARNRRRLKRRQARKEKRGQPQQHEKTRPPPYAAGPKMMK